MFKVAVIERRTEPFRTMAIDHTERAFEEVRRWKTERKKGEIKLVFDGTGAVSAVWVNVKIS